MADKSVAVVMVGGPTTGTEEQGRKQALSSRRALLEVASFQASIVPLCRRASRLPESRHFIIIIFPAAPRLGQQLGSLLYYAPKRSVQKKSTAEVTARSGLPGCCSAADLGLTVTAAVS